jgi:hypothetical protein
MNLHFLLYTHILWYQATDNREREREFRHTVWYHTIPISHSAVAKAFRARQPDGEDWPYEYHNMIEQQLVRSEAVNRPVQLARGTNNTLSLKDRQFSLPDTYQRRHGQNPLIDGDGDGINLLAN